VPASLCALAVYLAVRWSLITSCRCISASVAQQSQDTNDPDVRPRTATRPAARQHRAHADRQSTAAAEPFRSCRIADVRHLHSYTPTSIFIRFRVSVERNFSRRYRAPETRGQPTRTVDRADHQRESATIHDQHQCGVQAEPRWRSWRNVLIPWIDPWARLLPQQLHRPW
jgi:hypothetical protein